LLFVWINRVFFSGFNTTVDVKLQQWTEKELPRQCVDIGHSVLLDEFQTLIEREQKSRSHDPIANDLKMQVVQACRSRHKWDAKALDSLVFDKYLKRDFILLFFS
jgi:optic atrophy protein 1